MLTFYSTGSLPKYAHPTQSGYPQNIHEKKLFVQKYCSCVFERCKRHHLVRKWNNSVIKFVSISIKSGHDGAGRWMFLGRQPVQLELCLGPNLCLILETSLVMRSWQGFSLLFLMNFEPNI